MTKQLAVMDCQGSRVWKDPHQVAGHADVLHDVGGDQEADVVLEGVVRRVEDGAKRGVGDVREDRQVNLRGRRTLLAAGLVRSETIRSIVSGSLHTWVDSEAATRAAWAGIRCSRHTFVQSNTTDGVLRAVGRRADAD
jgi:hypothetical protein